MLLKSRPFVRTSPSREAKSVFIFCEGVKREVKYFKYFKEIDSRINIEIHPLSPKEDNSPNGLYKIACGCLIASEENRQPKYELLENDEVWIVIDTDTDKTNSRESQIRILRNECNQLHWLVAQSNPCFEVWLHNHFFDTVPEIQEIDNCDSWKPYVDNEISGGFDPRKHPIFIGTAIENAKRIYSETDYVPDIGKTQVFNLAESIYSLVKEKTEEGLKGNKNLLPPQAL